MLHILQFSLFFVMLVLHALRTTHAFPQFQTDDESREEAEGVDKIYEEEEERTTSRPALTTRKYKIFRNKSKPPQQVKPVNLTTSKTTEKLLEIKATTSNDANVTEYVFIETTSIPTETSTQANKSENFDKIPIQMQTHNSTLNNAKLNSTLDNVKPNSTLDNAKLNETASAIIEALIISRLSSLNKTGKVGPNLTKNFQTRLSNSVITDLSKSEFLRAANISMSHETGKPIMGNSSTSVNATNIYTQEMLLMNLENLPELVLLAIDSIECRLFDFCEEIDTSLKKV